MLDFKVCATKSLWKRKRWKTETVSWANFKRIFCGRKGSNKTIAMILNPGWIKNHLGKFQHVLIPGVATLFHVHCSVMSEDP